jgi:spore coat protein A
MKPPNPTRIPYAAATVMVGCLLLAMADPRRLLAHTTHPAAGQDPSLLPTNASTAPLTVTLTPFKDALQIPAVLQPSRTTNNYRVPVAPELFYPGPLEVYDIPMVEFPHQFHSELPPIPVWGYAGQYPGPTLETKVGVPIIVNWINQLTNNGGQYPFWASIDTNLFHGGHEAGVSPYAVRTVVHLHGAAVLPRYDGYPTNWFMAGESDEYFYGNIDLNEDGQTLWYHDHAVGVTANNVYAGLAGFYLVRNDAFDATNHIGCHPGPHEIPLVFQDRDFGVTTWTNMTTGELTTETNLYLAGFPWHQYPVVNGTITPFLQVEPRQYRFRILNGTGFRTLGLRMAVTDSQGNLYPTNDPSAPLSPTFTVVGNEDGYLQKAAAYVQRIAMMPGERIDVVVDFSAYTNAPYTNITVQNAFGLPTIFFQGPNGPLGPGGGGGLGANTILGANSANIENFITNLMQFQVVQHRSNLGTTNVNIPSPLVTNWVSTEKMVQAAVNHRQVTLDLNPDSPFLPFPGAPFVPNGNYPFALINMTPFHGAITDFPHAGDMEIWEIINLSDEAHPLHVHLLDFRVVNRQRFAASLTNLNASWDGSLTNPPAMAGKFITDRIAKTLQPLATYLSTNASDLLSAQSFETGPKDVVRAAPFAVTRIVMQWPTNAFFYTTPSGKSGDTNTLGRYIYHCHILDHEDNDMMRPLQLRPPWQPGVSVVSAPELNPGGFNHFYIAYDHRPNQAYSVETSTDLMSPVWTPVGTTPVLDAANNRWLHPPEPSSDPQRFYRVRGRLTQP